MIGVVGLGNWGTALAHHLAVLGRDVIAWDRDEEILNGITTTGRNPKYQQEAQLSPNLQVSTRLERVLECEIVVLVLPSSALQELVAKLQQCLLGAKRKPRIFISAIKGFEPSTHLTPLQYLRSLCGDDYAYAVLSGPSFAADIINQKPSSLVAASTIESNAVEVAHLFSSKTMKVYFSTDVIGVELGGILKNVIALAAGISEGLGFGDSARAGLITRGLAEMMLLAEKLGAVRETLFGLSGMGDLVMTATSDLSRNKTVGVRLGRGEDLSSIVTSLGSVAEGVKTAPVIHQIGKRLNVELPICELVVEVISGRLRAKDALPHLLNRPIRREF